MTDDDGLLSVELPEELKARARSLAYRYATDPRWDHPFAAAYRTLLKDSLEVEVGLLVVELGDERACELLDHVIARGELPQTARGRELRGVLRACGAAALFAGYARGAPWELTHVVAAFQVGVVAAFAVALWLRWYGF